jgi:hypothetical protein
MALHYSVPHRSAVPTQDAEGEANGLDLTGDRIVTAVATALAVLVVATIAILIGVT